jgi:hypothetical protein
MTPSIVILIALTVVTAGVAAYRKLIARDEDDYIHMTDPSGEIRASQQRMAASLNQIDRIGKGLTVATVAYGVALLAFFLYNGIVHPPV